MRRSVTIILLEGYALFLALWQQLGGVHTDEAKYLLNIPYPHPPLARGIFHLLDGMPLQDMFWRIVLASLLIQAVWFVWDMACDLKNGERMALSGAWLLCAAIVFQA